MTVKASSLNKWKLVFCIETFSLPCWQSGTSKNQDWSLHQHTGRQATTLHCVLFYSQSQTKWGRICPNTEQVPQGLYVNGWGHKRVKQTLARLRALLSPGRDRWRAASLSPATRHLDLLPPGHHFVTDTRLSPFHHVGKVQSPGGTVQTTTTCNAFPGLVSKSDSRGGGGEDAQSRLCHSSFHCLCPITPPPLPSLPPPTKQQCQCGNSERKSPTRAWHVMLRWY